MQSDMPLLKLYGKSVAELGLLYSLLTSWGFGASQELLKFPGLSKEAMQEPWERGSQHSQGSVALLLRAHQPQPTAAVGRISANTPGGSSPPAVSQPLMPCPQPPIALAG